MTVLLPLFNAGATVEAAIRSLLSQTLADWELVAVDDGSTDGTADRVEALGRIDPRIRLLRRPHRGLVAALEDGWSAAGGRFIARMDADDVAYPERLARQAGFLQAHPDVGLVGCRVDFGGDRQARAGYAVHVDWLNGLVTSGEIALNRFVESPFAHPSVMFRPELGARHGGYRDGPFPEDYELWLRWLEAGVRMAKVPQVLLRWNDPPGRLSRSDPRYDPAAFYAIKAPYLARWLRAHVGATRRLLVWGAGRLTRRRAEILLDHEVTIDGYVDIDSRKLGTRRDGRTVIGPGALPPPGEVFVLGYVAKRGARESIRATLGQRGYLEGRDFLMAA
ncbi:MAG: glycosyltransferase [Limisphaerales bacterium]